MKKKLAVLAAVLMASAVLGGCAQKAPETETKKPSPLMEAVFLTSQ